LRENKYAHLHNDDANSWGENWVKHDALHTSDLKIQPFDYHAKAAEGRQSTVQRPPFNPLHRNKFRLPSIFQ
jgi:hypothetical protein